MKRKLIVTGDGSHTLCVPQLQEHYHSTHGAIRESQHVYIDAALKSALRRFQTVHLLEVGFGTALNALLTLRELNGKTITYYTGIEAYPLIREEIAALNYPELLNDNSGSFQKLHEAPWNEDFREITSGFSLKKIQSKLQDVVFSENLYNVVYFDAFAPSVQPELWTKEIFEKIYISMTAGGVLSTYSSKGSVRRALQEVGFKVERLPAPAGKREMLRATKSG